MQNANMRNRSLIKLGISLIPQGVILVSNRITRHHGNADIRYLRAFLKLKQIFDEHDNANKNQ